MRIRVDNPEVSWIDLEDERGELRICLNFLLESREFRLLTAATAQISQISTEFNSPVPLKVGFGPSHPKEGTIDYPVTLAAKGADKSDNLVAVITLARSALELALESEQFYIRLNLVFQGDVELPMIIPIVASGANRKHLTAGKPKRESSPLRLVVNAFLAGGALLFLLYWNETWNTRAHGQPRFLDPEMLANILYVLSGYVGLTALRRVISDPSSFRAFLEFPELEIPKLVSEVLSSRLGVLLVLVPVIASVLLPLRFETQSLPPIENLGVFDSHGTRLEERSERASVESFPLTLACIPEGVTFNPLADEERVVGQIEKTGLVAFEHFEVEIATDLAQTVGEPCIVVEEEVARGFSLVKFQFDLKFRTSCLPSDVEEAVKDLLCGGSGTSKTAFLVDMSLDRDSPELRVFRRPQVMLVEIQSALASWTEEEGVNTRRAGWYVRNYERVVDGLLDSFPVDRRMPMDYFDRLYSAGIKKLPNGGVDKRAEALVRLATVFHLISHRSHEDLSASSVERIIGDFEAFVETEMALLRDLHPERPDKWTPEKASLRLYSRLLLDVQFELVKENEPQLADALFERLWVILQPLGPEVLAGLFEDLKRSGLLGEKSVTAPIERMCSSRARFDPIKNRFAEALRNMARQRVDGDEELKDLLVFAKEVVNERMTPSEALEVTILVIRGEGCEEVPHIGGTLVKE